VERKELNAALPWRGARPAECACRAALRPRGGQVRGAPWRLPGAFDGADAPRPAGSDAASTPVHPYHRPQRHRDRRRRRRRRCEPCTKGGSVSRSASAATGLMVVVDHAPSTTRSDAHLAEVAVAPGRSGAADGPAARADAGCEDGRASTFEIAYLGPPKTPPSTAPALSPGGHAGGILKSMSHRTRLVVALFSRASIGYIAVGSFLGRVLRRHEATASCRSSPSGPPVLRSYVERSTWTRAMAGPRLRPCRTPPTATAPNLGSPRSSASTSRPPPGAHAAGGPGAHPPASHSSWWWRARPGRPPTRAGLRPGDILKAIDSAHAGPFRRSCGPIVLLRGAPAPREARPSGAAPTVRGDGGAREGPARGSPGR